MSLSPRRLLVAATAALLAAAAAMPAQAASDRGASASGGKSEHDRIVEFWTPARVAQAVPRDFEYEVATGAFRPVQAKKGRPTPPPPPPSDLDGSWEGAGLVQRTTGKVLFVFGRSYYVCSASVVNDDNSDRSLVLTAGHCAYDWARGGQFAQNWMFVPDYDSSPATLTANGSYCSLTSYGCWTADALLVDAGFAGAGRFNTQATLHDYAVAVVGAGGLDGQQQLDATTGSQAVDFGGMAGGTDTYLFGYPAADPYDGTELVYSFGPLGFDPNNNNQTYRVASTMTGGSSGGPWFAPFVEDSGTGTQFSVNSYGYSGQDFMHGPIFNENTKAVYDTALGAAGDAVVPLAAS